MRPLLSLGGWLALLALALRPALAGENVFWAHDLRTAPEGAENRGGHFGAEGWTMRESRGFLRISLADAAPADGAFVVMIRGAASAELAKAVGGDRKIHFLNMFSNAAGDHHVEGGGTASDALWTLRIGTDPQGGERYPGGAKILWASRGAKRTPGSDYHEKRLPFPPSVRWVPGRWIEFRVVWSASEGTLRVLVDGVEAGAVPWKRTGDPLRHIFLGGAADFSAFVGATYRDLRIVHVSAAAESPKKALASD